MFLAIEQQDAQAARTKNYDCVSGSKGTVLGFVDQMLEWSCKRAMQGLCHPSGQPGGMWRRLI